MAEERRISKRPPSSPSPGAGNPETASEPRPDSPAQGPISPDWQRRIERNLESGEKALWVGQPDDSMALARPLPQLAAGMSVLLVFEVGLLLLGWNEIRAGNMLWLLLAAALGAAMIVLLLVPFWFRRMARRTCYVVTSKRAVIYQPTGFGKLNLISYSPEQLEEMEFKRSWFFGQDSGDLVFRKIITSKTMHYIDEGRMERTTSTQLFGFLMLRQAALSIPSSNDICLYHGEKLGGQVRRIDCDLGNIEFFQTAGAGD